MTITLSATYKETLTPEIVEIVDNLVENGYDLEDVLITLDYFGEEYQKNLEEIIDCKENNDVDNEELYDFIEEYSIDDLQYFEDYKSAMDDYNEDAVKAYIEVQGGVQYVSGFEDAYEGEFDRLEDFVDNFMENMGESIPSWVVVDHEATWNCSLRHDYYEENGFYFRNM
jgi:antirestriction protein